MPARPNQIALTLTKEQREWFEANGIENRSEFIRTAITEKQTRYDLRKEQMMSTTQRHFVIWESDTGTTFHKWTEHTQEVPTRENAEDMATELRAQEAKDGSKRNIRVIHRAA